MGNDLSCFSKSNVRDLSEYDEDKQPSTLMQSSFQETNLHDTIIEIKEIESVVYQNKNLDFELSEGNECVVVSGFYQIQRKSIGTFQFKLTGKNHCGRSCRGLWKDISYFEIKVIKFNSSVKRNAIGIGIAPDGYASKSRNFVGWKHGSVGFHSDDGDLFDNRDRQVEGTKFNIQRKFGAGDYVGCGFNHKTGEVFFTLNGEKLKPSVQRNVNLFDNFVPTISTSLQRDEKVIFKVIDGYDTIKNPFRFEEMNCGKMFKKIPEVYCDVIVYCE